MRLLLGSLCLVPVHTREEGALAGWWVCNQHKREQETQPNHVRWGSFAGRLRQALGRGRGSHVRAGSSVGNATVLRTLSFVKAGMTVQMVSYLLPPGAKC